MNDQKTFPTWWLILTKELSELWIGGKALILILIYTVLLGIITYVMATNSELSLIPPKEMVYEMLKNAMAVSLFVGLIIGADSISGERERKTLESILLTPTSRRQIVVGKFLAAASPWPVALILTIPYLYVLSQGDAIFAPAIIWGAILGTLLTLSYVGIGMLVSFWSSANKISYLVSLGIYILFLVPAQLPGRAQTGVAGQFLQWVNPLAAVNHFLSKHLVNYRTLSEFWTWLISPAVFAAIVLGLLFLYAASGLRLDAGRVNKLWSRLARKIGTLIIIGFLFICRMPDALAVVNSLPEESPLRITLDMESRTVKTGDTVEFNTVVNNITEAASRPLILAMNIINLNAQGDIVDPEDWSPQRTQYLDSLAPNTSSSHHWIINTILDGDYMIYMAVIPAPVSEASTSQPVASLGIHLTVTPYTKLNPRGVLPYTIGVPVSVLVVTCFIYWKRRAHIDSSNS